MMNHRQAAALRSGRNSIPDALRGISWSARFLWLAIAVLPFQQALTLDLGFPLKATEVLAFVGIILFVVERRTDFFKRTGPLFSTWAARLVVALALVVIVSSCWALVAKAPAPRAEAYPRGIVFDLGLYTCYAGFALALFIALINSMDWSLLARAVGVAVRLAAVYSVIQIVTWALDSGWLEAVNGNIQIGTLYGTGLPRNGPFLEGNYLGFFAACALLLLARSRDVVGVVVAVTLIAYSASTGAIVAIAVGVLLMIILRPSRRSVLATLGVVAAAATLFMVVPPLNRFATAQLTKLGLVENRLGDSYGYSLRSRTANADTGFSIALDNPLLGVGQGRYALHYWDHLDRTGLARRFGEGTARPIANNVYAQLAAETGLIALAIFASLLVLLLITGRREARSVVGLVGAIGVGLVAYPAWTSLVVWVMLAAAAAPSVASASVESSALLRSDQRREPWVLSAWG
ncbi:O-antigen ligase family protein [Microbacterium oryzae]|uniref:O-antigen ligase domain-containing protein n=1 Tax=Microbacterium oryzae TaxID=743009 RepID=A0A6I6E572_9MICO|nr:O-antigen ligase family protein [Microbacterium oryzae]QGU27560.1 O-antigen ligase domain-containing protein [Microbacterium oryzae]